MAIGYLIAHEELVEEEMESPSSFALNTIINQRALEMIQENIKQANLHIVKLKRGHGWRSMCVMLDTVSGAGLARRCCRARLLLLPTIPRSHCPLAISAAAHDASNLTPCQVRAAHTLINSFDHSVTHLGHCGNIAEGETERLLDVFTSRGEWLHHSTGDEVQESLPANMVRDLTMMSLTNPLKKADGRMATRLVTRRRQAIKFTPQKGAPAAVQLGEIDDIAELSSQPLPETPATKARVSFSGPPQGPRSPTPPASPPKGAPDAPAAPPASSPLAPASASTTAPSWSVPSLMNGKKEPAASSGEITYSPATDPEYTA